MKKTMMLLAAAFLFLGTSCAKKSESASVPAAPVAQEVSEDAPYRMMTIDPALKGEAILEAIKANYKDQVALLDFWATWCPPCRAAMQTVDEIKPALMDKGAVFVYITGETSPEETWKKMIPNIHGDHYRLTKAQWSDLCTQLGIPGIPAYMLIGKDGKTAWDNLSEGGYPGNDIVGNQIEVALTK